jgi:hypothetical protein
VADKNLSEAGLAPWDNLFFWVRICSVLLNPNLDKFIRTIEIFRFAENNT